MRANESMLAVALPGEKWDDFFDHPEYTAQEKLMGIRANLYKDGDICHIWTRGGHEVGHNFPHIIRNMQKISMERFQLDGELWTRGVADETIAGLANRKYGNPNDSAHIGFWAFDLTYIAGEGDLCHKKLSTRRKHLAQFAWAVEQGFSDAVINFLGWQDHNHHDLLTAVWAMGGEGVILKNLNAAYLPGKRRVKTWWKVKATETFDVVICGFKDAKEGKFSGQIGSFQYGMYCNDLFVPLGFCAGIDNDIRKDMTDNPGHWLGGVAELKAAGQDENSFALIEPRFLRRRFDKKPQDCILS
jgi:ATP-dependent DNA ligase